MLTRIVDNILRLAPLLAEGLPNFSLIPDFRSPATTTTSISILAGNCVIFCAAQNQLYFQDIRGLVVDTPCVQAACL